MSCIRLPRPTAAESVDSDPVLAPRAAVSRPMQRIPRFAACRELGVRAWTRGPSCCSRQWVGTCVRLSRPFTRDPGEPPVRRLSRRRFVFAFQCRRLCSSQPETGGTPGKRDGQPPISVVGIPDPMTWIHCRVQMFLTRLLFGLDTSSDEFHRGVKQVTQQGFGVTRV